MPFSLDSKPTNNGNKGTHSHRVYFCSQATYIKQHQLISTTSLTEKFLVTFSDRCCRGTRDNRTCCRDSWNCWNFAGRKWLHHWRGQRKKDNREKKKNKISHTLTNNHVQKQHSVFTAQSLGINFLATFSSTSNFAPCPPTVTKSYPASKGIVKHHLSSSSALYLCS